LNLKNFPKIPREDIERVDSETCSRYNDRLKQYGPNAKALGWLRVSYQRQRFAELVRHIDFSNRSIIDIGCGFADLVGFLRQLGIRFRSYIGIDINPKLIEIAKSRYPELRFYTGNPLLQDFHERADIVTIIGVANFRLERISNYNYTIKLLRKGFTLSRECVVANMISSYVRRGYPINPKTFHYSPERVFSMCMTITPYVNLIHDSRPMPQNEFLVVLKKRACER